MTETDGSGPSPAADPDDDLVASDVEQPETDAPVTADPTTDGSGVENADIETNDIGTNDIDPARIDPAGGDPAGVDTGEPPAVDVALREPMPRIPRLWLVAGSLWIVTVLAAIVISLIPSGYLVDAPGNAIDTSRLVTVPSSVKTYAHPGGFRMVTVSETNRPNFGQALVGWLDPDSDVFRRVEVLGDTPQADEMRYQLVLMQNAKLSAVFQAMDVLGLSAHMTGGGVFVDQIVPDSPAEGRLTIGDTITAIDGRSISTVDDIARFMNDAKPGQKIELTVDRMGVSQAKKIDLTLGSTERDGETAPFLGIYMETRPNYSFPFDVGFDTGDIAGPSAGLSLTLSLIDKLSPKSITGGREIAVTGTIQADGSVGAIGGIRQKVAAVRDAGVKYFLVPVDNAADAKKAAGKDVKVIPVKSLHDALDQLDALD